MAPYSIFLSGALPWQRVNLEYSFQVFLRHLTFLEFPET